MDQTLLVHVRQACQQLLDQHEAALGRQRPPVLQLTLQGVTFQQLHREEGHALRQATVVYRHHIGMGQGQQRLGLAGKTPPQRLSPSILFPQDLDGHGRAGTAVPSAIHNTKPAGT